MELSILIMKQLLVMFSLSGIGFLLAKLKLISNEGCKELVNLLLYAVIPLTVLNSFLVEKTPEKTQLLLYSLLLSLAVFAVSMLLSYIIYGKRKRVENFSAAFSNAGFIGIPLVQATVGPHAVFYIAGFVAFLKYELTAGDDHNRCLYVADFFYENVTKRKQLYLQPVSPFRDSIGLSWLTCCDSLRLL